MYKIFPIFIFWVMADCIYILWVTHREFQVGHQPKKSFKSGQIYRKECAMSWNLWKINFPIFYFFELWSILCSKFMEKLTNFKYKNYHISKIWNRFLIRFYTFQYISCIFHVCMNTFKISLSRNTLSNWLKKNLVEGFAPPTPNRGCTTGPRMLSDWGS